MDIYLVGGAVRDQLLGRPVTEKDWVVVGATPDDMLALGYTPVGKDFPVFLHPDTKDEYALARTERKTGKGYTGFECHASPDVTLEQDLLRRDLTVNAMAQTEEGDIIDPYNGQNDLKNKSLKHVSPAFVEDPLRILRVARFSARFDEFNVHPDTKTLMKTMVNEGEVDALVPERVFKELEKALNEKEPQRFFEVLQECGAQNILFPELKRTKDLAVAAQMTSNPVIRFATLAYQVEPGKIKALDARLKLPKEYRDLALLVSKFHDDYSDGFKKDAEGLLSLLEKTDAFRRPERFEDFIKACQAADYHDAAKPLKQRWMGAFNLANSISTQPFQDQNLKGPDFANALRQARLDAIGQL